MEKMIVAVTRKMIVRTLMKSKMIVVLKLIVRTCKKK